VRARSALAEQRIAVAKQQGVSINRCLRNSAGAVLFPACSPCVLAVGAVGQMGSYPEDSPQAAPGRGGHRGRGRTICAVVSCRGPKRLCARRRRGHACQSPDTYAICDSTSLAAAPRRCSRSLDLADHGDFRGASLPKIFSTVERLFQISRICAANRDPWQTGAGCRTQPGRWHLVGATAAVVPLNVGLREMRQRLRQLNEIQFGAASVPFEPAAWSGQCDLACRCIGTSGVPRLNGGGKEQPQHPGCDTSKSRRLFACRGYGDART